MFDPKFVLSFHHPGFSVTFFFRCKADYFVSIAQAVA